MNSHTWGVADLLPLAVERWKSLPETAVRICKLASSGGFYARAALKLLIEHYGGEQETAACLRRIAASDAKEAEFAVDELGRSWGRDAATAECLRRVADSGTAGATAAVVWLAVCWKADAATVLCIRRAAEAGVCEASSCLVDLKRSDPDTPCYLRSVVLSQHDAAAEEALLLLLNYYDEDPRTVATLRDAAMCGTAVAPTAISVLAWHYNGDVASRDCLFAVATSGKLGAEDAVWALAERWKADDDVVVCLRRLARAVGDDDTSASVPAIWALAECCSDDMAQAEWLLQLAESRPQAVVPVYRAVYAHWRCRANFRPLVDRAILWQGQTHQMTTMTTTWMMTASMMTTSMLTGNPGTDNISFAPHSWQSLVIERCGSVG